LVKGDERHHPSLEARKVAAVAVADEELVGRAAQGDTRAFEDLVERHQRYVFNLCLRMMGDYDLAAEMAQEVFLRAWRSIRSFRADARFTTWLYSIAHNLCLNRLESLQRDARHRVSEEDAQEELGRLHSKEEDPATAYERKERQGFVHRQIAVLPPRYRAVITLFYLQELSYQEIAGVTDLPIGTVKTHLFRAKEMMRRAMEDEVLPGQIGATDGVRGGEPAGRPGGGDGEAPIRLRLLPGRA
jgi:RNA polymerase sigma-70 factor (ECF subfamily)